MHLRITRGTVDPARIDELLALPDDVQAAYQQLPGFRTYTGGVDRRTGRVLAISGWDGAGAADFLASDSARS